MRVVVSYDLCEANARCMDACPEVFKVDDNDELHILIERPPESLRKKVEAAVAACPRAALKIAND
jgi:ferredoxin